MYQRSKIQELVRSAERNVRESEQSEYVSSHNHGFTLTNGNRHDRADMQPMSGSTIDANLQLPPRQVYTKHSFLAEISQMANTHDADELMQQGETEVEAMPLSMQTRPIREAENQPLSQGLPNMDPSPPVFQTATADRLDYTADAADYDMTWMLGPDFAMGNAEYDMLMDPFLRMHNGVENGPWSSQIFPGAEQNDTFYL